MTEQIITIAGKEVGIKYCFATEIGFKDIAGVSIEKYDPTDARHNSALIMAAVIPYYESRKQEPSVDVQQLMFEAKPKEIIEAITQVLNLRKEWYADSDEPKEESKDEGSEKNA